MGPGANGAFGVNFEGKPMDFVDGLSNTLAAGEKKAYVLTSVTVAPSAVPALTARQHRTQQEAKDNSGTLSGVTGEHIKMD